MTGNPLLNPIAEEDSKQSEEAIFQEYDHETYLKRYFSNESEDKDKNYKLLNDLSDSLYCSGKFILVISGLAILVIVLIMLVFTKIF